MKIMQSVSPRDYKFYAPRHKYRRTGSNSVSSLPGFPTFPDAEDSSSMSVTQDYQTHIEPQNQQQTPLKQHMQSLPQHDQFHVVNQNHLQSMSQGQHGQYSQQLNEIGHTQGSSTFNRCLVYNHSVTMEAACIYCQQALQSLVMNVVLSICARLPSSARKVVSRG